MYQVFPFVVAANLALPVELWSIIFRYLDPASLLNAVRTNIFWSRIILGDPILKKTVQEQLAVERQRSQQEILNPALLMTIERKAPPKMFGSNVPKVIRRRTPTVVTNVPADFLRSTTEKPKRRRHGDGGPHQNKKNVRVQPYRIRC